MKRSGFIVVVILLCAGVLQADRPLAAQDNASPRVEPKDFQYLGAFRLPDGDERPRTFEYGGSAMTFNPDGDPAGADDGFPGSLFIMGHDRMAYGELPATESKLRFAGADHVVLPSSISAQRIVQLITRPNVLDFLEEKDERSHLIELLSQLDLQIEEFTLPLESSLVGLAIAEVEAKGQGRFIIVAVRHQNGTLVTHPPLNSIP